MAREIFIVLDAGDPARARVRSFTDDSGADPIVIARSDDSKWRRHWLKRNPRPQPGRPFVYSTRPNSHKIGAGVTDATPTDGTFTLTGAAGGTTSALAYNASAATVQTAVRASLTGYGAAVVSLISTGVYEVDRGATGAVSDLTGNGEGLVPSGSTVNITNIQNGTGLLNEKWQVRLRKALPFLTTSGSAFASALVTVTLVQTGGASDNEIYTVAWNADAYAGSVWLNVSTTGSNNQTVGPIAYNATAEAVVAALAGHTAIATTDVFVEQTGPGSYNITFTGTLDLDAGPTIATDQNTLLVPVGDEGDIAMATSGADAILVGEDSAEITFEVEVREDSGKPRTVVNESATLIADLITDVAGQTTGSENFITEEEFNDGRTRAAVDDATVEGLTPDFIGQLAVSEATGKVYQADGVTLGDWNSDFVFETVTAEQFLATQGFKAAIPAAKTTTYAAAVTDHTILCDATGGSFDVDLPAAASASGLILFIKKVNAANTVSVDPNGAELIDGSSTSVALTTQWSGIVIQSNGTSWFKIGTI
jgi:hypothetical protein